MRRINIKDIGRFTEEQFNKVIRFAVIESQNSKSVPNVFGPFQNGQNIPRSALPPIRTNYRNEKAGNTYSIINNLPYAEAVTYGTNLPPSWGGTFKTRQDKRAGWPDPQVRTVSILVSKIKPKE